MLRSTTILLSASLATLSLLAACGGSGSTTTSGAGATSSSSTTVTDNGEATRGAQVILDDAKNQTSAAASIAIKGSINDGTGANVALDVQSVATGSSMGTVTSQGTNVQFIDIGGSTFFLKSTQLFLKFGGAAAVQFIGNRWIRVNATDPNADQLTSAFKTFADVRTLASEFLSGTSGILTKKGPSTINGIQAIEVDDSQTQYFVATEGKPVLLRVAKVGGGGQLDLTYDQPTSIGAPADSDVIDLSQIQALAGGSSGSATT